MHLLENLAGAEPMESLSAENRVDRCGIERQILRAGTNVVSAPGDVAVYLGYYGPSQSTGRLWVALCCDEVPSDHQEPSLTGGISKWVKIA